VKVEGLNDTIEKKMEMGIGRETFSREHLKFSTIHQKFITLVILEPYMFSKYTNRTPS
jgi:hypothetical protein